MSAGAGAHLYGLLHSAGVCCVSVGQDSAQLRALHARVLTLHGGGRWTLEPAG